MKNKKRINKLEYRKLKELKDNIKSISEKETKEPLLKSSVKLARDPYGLDMGLMFPLLMSPMIKTKRRK